MRLKRDVYTGFSRLFGEERANTLQAANNYAWGLLGARRFEEAKAFMRKILPVARRFSGDDDENTLRMRLNYAGALCQDPGATLDDLREAVATLEDAGRIARRVMGGANPLTVDIEDDLEESRAALRAREGDDVSYACDAVEMMTMRK